MNESISRGHHTAPYRLDTTTPGHLAWWWIKQAYPEETTSPHLSLQHIYGSGINTSPSLAILAAHVPRKHARGASDVIISCVVCRSAWRNGEKHPVQCCTTGSRCASPHCRIIGLAFRPVERQCDHVGHTGSNIVEIDFKERPH